MEAKKPGLRQLLTAAVFILVIGVLFVLNLVIKPPQLLISERRAPAQLPALNLKNLASGDYMDQFESHAADTFSARDGWRSVRAFTVLDILMQSDKSGLYFGASGAGEFNQLDTAAAGQTAEKIKKAADSITDCNIYYSLIPDKSLYAGRYLPGLDMAQAEALLRETLGGYTYIPITDCLDAESFYKTDIHWTQPKIGPVAQRLCDAMGTALSTTQYSEICAGEFKGIYAGQMALPMAPDKMIYMDAPGISASILNETTLVFEPCPVYDLERFQGADPYDIFLRGAQPLIVLENAAAPQRELFLFRDSFGSSLSPLLAGAYSKITVIDLRYIDFRILDQFVDFTPGSDVLFLYSSQILNNPSILMV